MSLQDYALGKRITPLVPIENIDRVPVTFVNAVDDYRCPTAFAEAIYQRVPTPDKTFLIKNASHAGFRRLEDSGWIKEIDEII